MSHSDLRMSHIIPRDVTPEMGPIVLRFVLNMVGVALVVSTFGVWMVPGAQGLPALSLMKLGISLAALIAGLCCLAASKHIESSDL